MRAAPAVMLALSAAAAMALRAAPAVAQNAHCDRPCLESLADLYVAAVVAHDPSRLPLGCLEQFPHWHVPFKIVDGKIGPVESVLHPVPYGMDSGWSTWEQALSSDAREK